MKPLKLALIIVLQWRAHDLLVELEVDRSTVLL